MQMRRVESHDDVEFASWFDVLNRSDMVRAGHTGQGWHPDEWRARAVRNESSKVWHLLRFDVDANGPVAVAAVEFAPNDDLNWLRGELHVEPDLRRRGYGSTALALLEKYVKDLGSSQLAVNAVEGALEVGSSPSRAFAPRWGYQIGDEAVRRDISWPRPLGELDELEARWRPKAEQYEVFSWVGSTPDRWVKERAKLHAVMPGEIPYADLATNAEVWDSGRLRRHESTVNEMGRELFVSVARQRATNELVGHSELTVSREYVETAYQWDTLVVSAHRGHRLGGLLKIATMRLLASSGIGVRRISTTNSTLNTPMIRVNEELGAKVAGSSVLWRKDL